jgi:hypothetical protein
VKRVFVFLLCLLVLVPASSADTSFLRALVDKPSTTFGDAVYMLVRFLGNGQAYPDFAAGKSFLEGKSVLAGSLRQKSEQDSLRRGELAEMAVTALEVRGGVAMRMAYAMGREGRLAQGVFRRYALKEAVFLQWMTEGDAHADVSGQELISVISRMENYQEEQGMIS